MSALPITHVRLRDIQVIALEVKMEPDQSITAARGILNIVEPGPVIPNQRLLNGLTRFSLCPSLPVWRLLPLSYMLAESIASSGQEG
jgi:hypothetical protein